MTAPQATARVGTALVLACLLPTWAWAQDLDAAAAAKLHRDAGALFFQRGSYAEAIEQFEKARSLAPVPEDLFNIGQAERLRGNCPAALRAYAEYLQGNPEPARREATEINVARCEAELGRADQPQPETIVSPTPAGPPDASTPAPPPATAQVASDAPAPAPWYHDRIGGVLAGAGLVGVAAGTALWVMADARTRGANEADSLDEHRRRADSAASLRLGAAVATGVGVILLGGAVYRYATRPSRRASVRVGAMIDGDSGFVVLELLQ